METTDLQIYVTAQQNAHDVPIRTSSVSDTAMTSEAGGDPAHEQLSMGSSYGRLVSMGDPLVPLGVVAELRDELAEMRQAYHHEVYASRSQSREISNRHNLQTYQAMIQQHGQFHEAALRYERVAATMTEAAVAQERTVQRSVQQQQHLEH